MHVQRGRWSKKFTFNSEMLKQKTTPNKKGNSKSKTHTQSFKIHFLKSKIGEERPSMYGQSFCLFSRQHWDFDFLQSESLMWDYTSIFSSKIKNSHRLPAASSEVYKEEVWPVTGFTFSWIWWHFSNIQQMQRLLPAQRNLFSRVPSICFPWKEL